MAKYPFFRFKGQLWQLNSSKVCQDPESSMGSGDSTDDEVGASDKENQRAKARSWIMCASSRGGRVQFERRQDWLRAQEECYCNGQALYTSDSPYPIWLVMKRKNMYSNIILSCNEDFKNIFENIDHKTYRSDFAKTEAFKTQQTKRIGWLERPKRFLHVGIWARMSIKSSSEVLSRSGMCMHLVGGTFKKRH